MRIGVTGSSGFLGSNLTKALQHTGAEVAVLQRKSSESFPAINELNSFIRGLNLIYHIAGVNRGTNDEIFKGNVEATFNLVEAVKKFGKSSPRIVFASSSQVYKPLIKSTKVINEFHKTEPDTLFGLTKKMAEDLIRFSGFEHVILRISNTYGPGSYPNYNSVISTFCYKAINGDPLTINGNGYQKRDFIYVEDAIRAMLLAGTKRGKLVSGVYNVGTGRAISIRQMIRNIKATGVKVETTYSQKSDTGQNSFSLDASRFRKRFGWKPKVSPRMGIKNTLSWFQQKTPL